MTTEYLSRLAIPWVGPFGNHLVVLVFPAFTKPDPKGGLSYMPLYYFGVCEVLFVMFAVAHVV